MAGHQGGAGARAAGQGRTGAPLPHPHHQVIGGKHLHEMNVGFSREAGVHLQQGAKALQIKIGQVLHRHHDVGIAHPCRGDSKDFAIHLQIPLGQAGRTQGQGGGNRGRLQEGRAHVDPDGTIVQQLRHDPARQGVHLPAAAGAIAIAIGQEAGQAADAIATHLRFAAIGVEDAHAQLPTRLAREGQDHAVATDAEATVAKLADQLRCQAGFAVRLGGLAAIHQQEVIA